MITRMPANYRQLRPWIVGLSVLAAGAVGLAVWYETSRHDPPPEASAADTPPPDPRLTLPTPYRNVRPEVRYVGDAACAGCHPQIDATYHAHPMGRSAALVAGSVPIEKYDRSAHDTFPAGPFELRVEKTPDGVVQRVRARDAAGVPLPDYVVRADVAIGSGTRGRSYLAVEQGAVWQAPVSWFGPDARWDLSPGFGAGKDLRRPIAHECLFCHVDRVEPVPGSQNRYREPLFPVQAAIGCERCHGPGELHVAERTDGRVPDGADTSIVNPKHLSPELRAAVCEQCHLQGEERVLRRGRDVYEFRPGLPFELFATTFVRHPDIATWHKSVGQFEQMERSRCYAGSGGRLGCTSCHDPHEAPAAADRDRVYRGRCLTCHESKGCSLPQPERLAKSDSCIACHMPKADSANITHASVTDHRVPRKPTPPPTPRQLPFGTAPLVRFRTTPHSPLPAEQDRDLGIALARHSAKTPDAAARDSIRALARERLTAALANWPADPAGWLALGSVRTTQDERLRAAAKAAELAPGSDDALGALLDTASAAKQFDVAEEAAGKLIRANPTAVDPLLGRAFVSLSRQEWGKAEADCRAALRIYPLHPEARLYLAICRNHAGDAAGGRREAETAAGLEADPRQRKALLDWYERATR